MLEPDVSNLPLGSRYEGKWVAEAKGTYDLWLPIRDINGLTEASTAIFRAKAREFSQLSHAEAEQRKALLEVAMKIILAERELTLREFAKLLPDALAQT